MRVRGGNEIDVATEFWGPTERRTQTPVRVAGLRARETRRIIELIASGHRLITITGLGGIGKSALAVDVVDEFRRERPDFGCSVIAIGPAGGVGIRERLLDELADAPGNPDSDETQQRDAPESRLVVIEGGEHLLERAEALTEIIESNPSLYVLVTSRIALGVPSEVTVPLRGLDTAAGGDAMKMFLSMAEDHSVEVGRADQPRAREIVARLGGYPLAIQLCAAQLRTRTLSSLHEGMIGQHDRQHPPSQPDPGLREIIEWTLDRQSAQAIKLLKVLTVFRGWCTIDSIEGIAAAVERHSNGPSRRIAGRTLWLAELIESGLVDVEETSGFGDGIRLYRVHDSVREVAQNYRVDGEPPASALRTVHREWFTAKADELAAASATRRESSAFELLQAELPEYVNALDAEIEYDPTAALQVLNQLGEFWITRGRIRSGGRLMRHALREIGEDENGLGSGSLDAVLAQSWLGHMNLRVGVPMNVTGYQAWLSNTLQGVLDASVEPTPEHFALAVHFIFVAMVNNDYDTALHAGARSRDLAVETGDDYHAGVFCFYLARVAEQTGDAAAAAGHIKRAIVHVRRTENETFLARCISESVLLRRDQLGPGELVDQLKPLSEFHVKNRSFKDAALISAPLAIAYFQADEPREALALLRRTLALSHRVRYFDGQLYSVVLIAFSELSQESTRHDIERCARLYGSLRPYLARFNAITAPGYQQMLQSAIQGLRLMLGQGALDRITAQSPTVWSQVIAEADAFAAEQEQAMPNRVAEPAPDVDARVTSKLHGLSDRERKLLELVLTGIADKQIAEQLRLKPNTVRSYNSRIFRKFDVASRTELLALFRGRDL